MKKLEKLGAKGLRITITVFWFAIFSLFTNCKSVNKVLDVRAKSLSAKKIIDNHHRAEFKHNTFSAALHTEIQKPRQLSANIRLRAKKDEVIWMSVSKLGINIAKFVATKDSLKFYNKLNKTYFEGDFSIVQQLLGAPIDFFQLQNLLLGQAFVDFNDTNYESSIVKNKHHLKPKEQGNFLSYLFWLDPVHFKINQQVIEQKNPKRFMDVNYVEYQQVNGEFFPKKMQITSKSEDGVAAIEVDFRRVILGHSLSFPFKIPDNYQKISSK